MVNMRKKPIYVEIDIKKDIDTIWTYTQQPALHEQWDLRFSSITYNEKLHEDDEQTFTYTTNIMPAIKVSGWGVSKGTYERDGARTSSLHFGTPQLLSPIAEGKGYWKYIPNREGVTFLTQYDYQVRFGVLGKVLDVLFRPIMGWATALSFHVLKRWIEEGEHPALQYRRFFSFYMICLLFFFIWLYQGLVPKVLLTHPLEVELLMQLSGLEENLAKIAVFWIGLLEIGFAFMWLAPFRKKILFGLQIILFPLLTISAFIADSSTSTGPFNVISLNTSLFVLSIIGYLLCTNLPTAKTCKRKRS